MLWHVYRVSRPSHYLITPFCNWRWPIAKTDSTQEQNSAPNPAVGAERLADVRNNSAKFGFSSSFSITSTLCVKNGISSKQFGIHANGLTRCLPHSNQCDEINCSLAKRFGDAESCAQCPIYYDQRPVRIADRTICGGVYRSVSLNDELPNLPPNSYGTLAKRKREKVYWSVYWCTGCTVYWV